MLGEMNMQWRMPWKAADGGPDTDALQAELPRECPAGHVLVGLQVEFIASRQDCDDFPVVLEDDRGAVVHLPWSIETSPFWPHTEIYADLNDWVENGMLPLAAGHGWRADRGQIVCRLLGCTP